MGAQTFYEKGSGKDVKDAFRRAVDHSAWMNGHGGYTGTLAEKHEYVVIEAAGSDLDKEEYAVKLVNDGDARIDDKWGPAGAIRLADDPGGEQVWLFFGWASS